MLYTNLEKSSRKTDLKQNLKSIFTKKEGYNRFALIVLTTFVIISTAVLAAPVVPEISYKLNPPDPNSIPSYPVTTIAGKETFLTDGNRLVISKIGVDSKVLEGESEDIMLSQEGVWREPNSAIPGNPGNMVIAGHRFQYLPPNTATLYNLDKLESGDSIKVYWNGSLFTYKVSKIFEVLPEELWITSQDNSAEELTIYTCTPIYTSEKRLVVKATLEQA